MTEYRTPVRRHLAAAQQQPSLLPFTSVSSPSSSFVSSAFSPLTAATASTKRRRTSGSPQSARSFSPRTSQRIGSQQRPRSASPSSPSPSLSLEAHSLPFPEQFLDQIRQQVESVRWESHNINSVPIDVNVDWMKFSLSLLFEHSLYHKVRCRLAHFCQSPTLHLSLSIMVLVSLYELKKREIEVELKRRWIDYLVSSEVNPCTRSQAEQIASKVVLPSLHLNEAVIVTMGRGIIDFWRATTIMICTGPTNKEALMEVTVESLAKYSNEAALLQIWRAAAAHPSEAQTQTETQTQTQTQTEVQSQTQTHTQRQTTEEIPSSTTVSPPSPHLPILNISYLLEESNSWWWNELTASGTALRPLVSHIPLVQWKASLEILFFIKFIHETFHCLTPFLMSLVNDQLRSFINESSYKFVLSSLTKLDSLHTPIKQRLKSTSTSKSKGEVGEAGRIAEVILCDGEVVGEKPRGMTHMIFNGIKCVSSPLFPSKGAFRPSAYHASRALFESPSLPRSLAAFNLRSYVQSTEQTSSSSITSTTDIIADGGESESTGSDADEYDDFSEGASDSGESWDTTTTGYESNPSH